MSRLIVLFFVFSFFLISSACSSSDKKKKDEPRGKITKAEYIVRRSNTAFYPLSMSKHRAREPYPWEKPCSLPHISKEFFRCKGSHIHTPVIDSSNPEKIVTFQDCNGRHGFPTKKGVYPILIELLNYLQRKTQKKVIITSGYRCLTHNQYTDRSRWGRNSKHLIGAEVDFYVEGYEEKPEQIVQLVLNFYKAEKRYHTNKEYQSFSRYEKKTNASTKPWYNKEIFLKLLKAEEGRNFDNRHPYPYLSVQVRYDREQRKRVLIPY